VRQSQEDWPKWRSSNCHHISKPSLRHLYIFNCCNNKNHVRLFSYLRSVCC
jgi:hypothetical protein